MHKRRQDLLRCLAMAAPLSVINSLYFTNLRVKKQIKQLILVSAILSVVTLGITYNLLLTFWDYCCWYWLVDWTQSYCPGINYRSWLA